MMLQFVEKKIVLEMINKFYDTARKERPKDPKDFQAILSYLRAIYEAKEPVNSSHFVLNVPIESLNKVYQMMNNEMHSFNANITRFFFNLQDSSSPYEIYTKLYQCALILKVLEIMRNQMPQDLVQRENCENYISSKSHHVTLGYEYYVKRMENVINSLCVEPSQPILPGFQNIQQCTPQTKPKSLCDSETLAPLEQWPPDWLHRSGQFLVPPESHEEIIFNVDLAQEELFCPASDLGRKPYSSRP